MEKLRHYLEKKNIPQQEFAAVIGVYQATISRYIRGERFPEPEIILKIEKATDGYVEPKDWYANFEKLVDDDSERQAQPVVGAACAGDNESQEEI